MHTRWLGLFSSWQILPPAPPLFNSTTVGQPGKFHKAYQTNLFNLFPVQPRPSWRNTKQPRKTSPFHKTSRPLLSSENVPERCLLGQIHSPTHQSCSHISPLQNQHGYSSKARPGSSWPPSTMLLGTLALLFLLLPRLAWLQRLPVAIVRCRRGPGETPPARLSEGKGCFIYGAEKIKLLCCFFIRNEEEEESSLIFGNTKVCSLCAAFKGTEGSVAAGYQMSPSLRRPDECELHPE